MFGHAEKYQSIILEASSVAVDTSDASRSQNSLSVILSRVNSAYDKLMEMQKDEVAFSNVSLEEYRKLKRTSKDLISQNTMKLFLDITNKSNHTLIHLSVLKQLDIILENKWYDLDSRQIWDLINLVVYMHLLYNIFKGSYVGERAIVHSKFILLSILEKKSASLQKDQMDHISKMLAFDPIKNVAKVMRFFDVSTKDIKSKFESDQLQVKIDGLKELSIIFGNTKTYKE